jgi:trimethylamine--corrinoid protein Co-methyltransferase
VSVKRSGRKARLKAQTVIETPAIVRRVMPPFAPFPATDIQALEEHANWLLSEIGIEFRDDPEALEILHGGGAQVDGQRVRFPDGLARRLCQTAPSQFELVARNPKKSVLLGGDHIVFMPGYGSPFVTDLKKGRRYATLDDFHNFVRMTYASPHLHHSGGTVVEPTDLPVSTRHLDMTLAHLTQSDKPFMGAVTHPDRAHDSLNMARIVFGKKIDSSPVIQANINVNSPLVYDGTMTGALRAYAQASQCVCISPAIFGGAMGPVTPAAVAAQTHAEILAGVALCQLICPGCPVVYGSFHNTMSLKSGALTFGTPEANLVTFALGQLARNLNIPFRSGGGEITSANSADGQAMSESVSALWPTVLSGANQVWHAAGWLEGGLTMGYEKFAMDLDICGALLKMIGGMKVSEETLSKKSYLQVNPGENFLGTEHTLENFSTANYEPDIAEPGPFETWQENGSPTAEQRAFKRWNDLLGDYETPEIDTSLFQDLNAFVDERKSDLPVEWY